MKLYSPETVQRKLDITMQEYTNVMNEMGTVPTVEDSNKLVDIAERAQALKNELDALGDVEASDASLIDSLGISSEVFNSEVTVLSVIHVLGRASSLLNDVLASGLTDDEADEIKRAITGNADFTDLKSNTANVSRVSKGKLSETKAVEYREMFASAWESNNNVKIASFMRENDIPMQYYSFNTLIRGGTYTDAGGPIRGIDYDVDDDDDNGMPPVVDVVESCLVTTV